MNPTISVLMPVYNQEKYVAETIESVLSQTFMDYEFLIVDDGSKDGSADIIKAYAAKDSRIKAFYEKNSGKCNATNFLLSEAKGEWSALIDADDLMLPERLEKQLNYHKAHPTVEATSCHCFTIDEKGKPMGVQVFPGLTNEEEVEKVRKENGLVMCAFTGMMISTALFKKIGGLRSQFWPSEDFEVSNRIVESGAKLVILQEFLMKYRLHTSSITQTNPFNMFLMDAYVRRCISDRRQGRAELTLQEFKKIREKDSAWIKFKRRWLEYSKIYHRRATFAFHSKRFVNFSWLILISSILSPSYVYKTLFNRVKNRSLAS
jgi:glycosyltransferase involved in cell wall biosynthesis